jgi:DNA end-binding protein Ku
MPRATWKGTLRLSLVSCHVFLTPATVKAKPLRLHRVWAPQSATQVAQDEAEDDELAPINVRRDEPARVAAAEHPRERARAEEPEEQDEPITVTRVSMRAHNPQSGEELDRGELAHGYEVERGRYVTLTSAELKALAPPRSTVLDLALFVPASELDDPLYFDAAYYVYPDGSAAIEPYRVIAAAMERGQMVGITSLTLQRREHMAMVAPRGGGLLLTTLRVADEVRPAEFQIPDDGLDPEMIDIAEVILKRRAGHFDPATLRDKYQDALRDLIKDKAEGLPATAAPQPQTGSTVVDLMAALKQSLAQERGTAPRPRRKAVRDWRQPSLLLPVSGSGRAKKASSTNTSRRRRKA